MKNRSNSSEYTLRFYEKKISEHEAQYTPVDKQSKEITSKFPRFTKKLCLTSKNFHMLQYAGFKMEIEK